jgi:hypothetical protein
VALAAAAAALAAAPADAHRLTHPAEADATIAGNGLPVGENLSQLSSDVARSALIRFTVPHLRAPVRRAVLRLYSVDPSGDGIHVHTATGAWTEGGVNGANRPQRGPRVSSTTSTPQNRWTELDVTDAVGGAGTYTFEVVAAGIDPAGFHSRENVNPPQLEVLADEPLPPREDLARAVGDVRDAHARVYRARDDHGADLAALKVVERPGGGYLGVYHDENDAGVLELFLGSSSDLITWTRRARLARNASQGDLVTLPEGGFLLAYERDWPVAGWGNESAVSIRYYATLDALLRAEPSRSFDAPRNLSPHNEGTPSFLDVDFAGGPERSKIELGLHHLRPDVFVDRNAKATLVGFGEWTVEDATQYNSAFEAAGVGGNLGDRDDVRIHKLRFRLQEGQLIPRDFGSWRVWLHEHATGTNTRVAMRTDGGSSSFGNPTATLLTAPSGRPALMMSAFVFGENAAPGEAGALIYYRELGG